MANPQLDRRALKFKSLEERRDRVYIVEDHVPPDSPPPALDAPRAGVVAEAAERFAQARAGGQSRMLAFGAHAIKNGLAPVMIDLMERGWISHFATNGAGIIHDWEFAFQGHSSEHVAENVARGEFGHWEETGYYLNLALLIGAYEGLGYGESIGALVENGGCTMPSVAELTRTIVEALPEGAHRAAAAADVMAKLDEMRLEDGEVRVEHPYRKFGLQAAAYRLGVPLTGHPMFGHDIIYNHPMNCGAAVGRTAEQDFLTFAGSVAGLDGGIYLSLGSAVMSPMIFEKSLSMAQNLAIQRGERIENHLMIVVDLQESHWDWRQGEPPEDNPDYYLRYTKSFSRMGGAMRYLSMDNRDFLLALSHALRAHE